MIKFKHEKNVLQIHLINKYLTSENNKYSIYIYIFKSNILTLK